MFNIRGRGCTDLPCLEVRNQIKGLHPCVVLSMIHIIFSTCLTIYNLPRRKGGRELAKLHTRAMIAGILRAKKCLQ